MRFLVRTVYEVQQCIIVGGVRLAYVPFFFFFFLILRRMGKNKAEAHHTSTYFHTRRVSI